MMRILLYCLPIIYRDNMYIIAKKKRRLHEWGERDGREIRAIF